MSFIKSVIQENENVTIAKFNGKAIEVTGTDSDEYTPRICFLDLETTGLNKQQDQIIEIALKIVSANKNSGEISYPFKFFVIFFLSSALSKSPGFFLVFCFTIYL